MSSIVQTSSTTDNDEATEVEHEESFQTLAKFPDAGKRYNLRRVAGGDVLQNVQEHNVEGYLEVSEDAKFANFYAKFPDDHGVVAGRIDYTGCRGEAPSMYFHAIACRAHINYGIWQGVIHRDGDTPGVGFMGTIVEFGTNVAVAGSEHHTAKEPLIFNMVHAFHSMKDEPEPHESWKDQLPDGYQRLKSGAIGFTLFFDDGSGHYNGRSAPIPATFWFESIDSKQKPKGIPKNVLKEIGQLTSYPYVKEANEDGNDNEDEEVKKEPAKKKRRKKH